MKHQVFKRLLALMLAVLMAVSVIGPVTAFAEQEKTDEETVNTVNSEPTEETSNADEKGQDEKEQDETEDTPDEDEGEPRGSEAERGEEKPSDPISIGALTAVPDHPTQDDGGLIWTKSAVSVTDTWTDYYATSDDCVIITKAKTGVSEAIGLLTEYGTSDGILVNCGENIFCIRNSQWNLNCAGHSSITPMEPGDTLVVSGEFYTNNGTRVIVSPTVITKGEDGKIQIGGETPTMIEAGVMKLDPAHPQLNSGSFYFTMDDNDIPYTEGDWDNAFYACSESCLQLIRDGAAAIPIAIASEGRGVFVKMSANGYYLNTSSKWFIGKSSPLRAGDTLIVEGDFTNGTVTFHVSYSEIKVEADGSLTFSTGEKPDPTVIEAGVMKEHPNGKTNSGFYFSMDENAVPADSTWVKRYIPVSADVIQRTRNGETVNVGNTAAETILKFNDTGWWMEYWAIGGALIPGDILTVEGNFTRADGVTFHISKSIITCNEDGSLTFSAGKEPEPETIEAGVMKEHPNGKTNSGFFFSMDENAVPADSTWAKRYIPVSEDVIQRTRNGETVYVGNTAAETILKFNDTGWWMEYWAIGGALIPGDILTVEGNFARADGVTFHISRSYVICNADGSLTVTDTLPEPITVIEAGIMHRSDKAPESDGFYFEMDTNDVPIDSTWTDRYQPVSADVITLTRDGETKNVGNIGADTVLKYSENGWYMAYWAIGGALQPGDILTVSGNFENPNGVVFHISESTVEVNKDGSLTVNGEAPAAKTVIEGGYLCGSDAGRTDTGIYCTMDANEVPYLTDWSLAYKPTSADCIKLVRGEETVSIARPVAEILVKYDETKYYLKTEAYTMGDSMPLQEGDILIVEGDFFNEAENVVLNITASYIRIENGQAVFYTEYPTDDPDPEIIEAGIMHRSDKAPASDGFYFEMEANDVPVDSTWIDRYMPLEPGVILRTRNGETTAVGNTGAGTILKYSANGWFMAYWAIGGALQPGDVLTVSGNFSGPNGVVFHISQSVITVNDDGSLTINGEEPPKANRINAGTLKGSDAGRTENGIYCTMDANAAPYDEGWTLLYKPTSADCVKLVRNGETISIGNPAAETIVKYAPAKYYFKTEQWLMPGTWPLQEGDILIVEGDFVNEASNTILNITTSYIKIQYGQAVFSDTYPEDEPVEVIQAGYLKQDTRPRTSSGIYVTMDENAAPYAKDWTVEYKPLSTSCIKLVRNGETVDIAIPGRGTLTKFNETGYFLKADDWSFGEYAPLQVGDILIVEGQFAYGENVMEISTSYISLLEGKTVVSTEYPTGEDEKIIEAGVMSASKNNPGLYVDQANGTCGVYFTMPENEVPLKSSDPWNNRFYPVNEAAIKLIRNGETIAIANVDAGEIVKFKSTDYYLALDKWAHSAIYPITEDDILVIEGNFTNGETVFHISQSYISFQYGTAIFSTTYPNGNSNFKIVDLYNVQGDERGKADTGAYFDAAVNAAPYSSAWNVAYSPTKESCFKLIRNGQTYDVGIIGHEAIVKFSPMEYFVKTDSWAMGSFAPLREGDILVLEGEFVNGANGVVINVPRTYIGIWYGKAFVSSEYMSGPAISVVNTGDMLNDERDFPGTGVYFDMEENRAPADNTWHQEYSPLSADCIRLIRDGKTYDIAIGSHGTIVKFTETEYFLKLDTWAIGSYAPIRDGDILIVGGSFINVQSSYGTMLKIPESYIFFRGGKAVIAKAMGEVEIGKDESIQLTPENVPEGEEIVWSSENDKRVSVDQNGNVTALTNRGTIRVFATAGKACWFWEIKMYEETEFGKIYLSSSDEDLPIGVWCGSFHEFPYSSLEALEDAGVTVLVGVKEDQTGEGGMWALLNRAREHGISVIADIRGWDGKTEFSYVKHDALKGFLVWDEPTASDFGAISELKASFDAMMPDDLTFFVNLNSQTASYEALFGDGSGADYGSDYADAYIRTVGPDQISFTSDGLRKEADGLALPEGYYNSFGILAQKSANSELPLAYTIPVIGNSEYALPDEAMLRWHFALGLTFGAKSVNHYAYASDEEGSVAMVDPESHKPTDLLDDIETVNKEFFSWSDIILSYSWLGISKIDSGEVNPLLAALTGDVSPDAYGCISSVESEQDLLIGSFINGDGDYAYMLTNAGDAKTSADGLASFTMSGGKVTLTLKDGDYRCVALIQKGEISYVAVGADNTVTIELDANDSVFMIPFMK